MAAAALVATPQELPAAGSGRLRPVSPLPDPRRRPGYDDLNLTRILTAVTCFRLALQLLPPCQGSSPTSPAESHAACRSPMTPPEPCLSTPENAGHLPHRSRALLPLLLVDASSDALLPLLCQFQDARARTTLTTSPSLGPPHRQRLGLSPLSPAERRARQPLHRVGPRPMGEATPSAPSFFFLLLGQFSFGPVDVFFVL